MSKRRVERLEHALNKMFLDEVHTMMAEQFDKKITIFVDPEDEKASIMNVDDSPITEAQFYALAFFETGWYRALKTVEYLGQRLDQFEDEAPENEDPDRPTEGQL